MLKFTLIFVVGIITGFINVLGGGGSFLTLPLLIFLGLPSTVANGTNRIGILLQNISAIFKYRAGGHLPLKFAVIVTIPVVLGSILGAKLAVMLPDKSFTKYLAVFMFVMTLITLFNPAKKIRFTNNRVFWLASFVIFFVIGVYGGFIQAGVGFLLLAGTTILGYDLIKGNGIKVFIIFVLTLAALPVFMVSGKIDYVAGIVLGIGSAIGGMLGASISIKKGVKLIRNFVAVSIIIFSVILLMTS